MSRDTIWNILGSSIPLLVAVFAIPFLMRQLGNESFGILTLVWALIGYLSFFDLGLGKTLTYEISRLKDAPQDVINNTLVGGVFITFCAGLFGSALLLFFAPYITNLLKLSPQYHDDALLSFQICAVSIVPTTLTSGLRGALEGFNDFFTSNLVKIAIGISMFLLPMIAIFFAEKEVWKLTASLCFFRVLVCFWLVFKMIQYFSNLNINLIFTRLRSLVNYSAWVWISAIVGPIMVYGDRFFVGSLVPMSQLPIYTIPQEGIQRLLIYPTAVCNSLLPKVSTLNFNELKNIHNTYHAKVFRHMALIVFIAILLVYPVLSLWISPEFAKESFVISIIICIGVLINSISLVPSTIIQAQGNVKLIAISHIVELLIYIFLVWYLTKNFGLTGAACAWTIRQLADYLFLKYTVRNFSN